MQAVEIEGRTDPGQFFHEPVHVPQGEIARAIRASAAELVVKNDPAAVRQGLERLEVMVGEAGSAVQAEQRDGDGFVAHGAVPDLAAGDLDVALFRLHEAGSSLSRYLW